MFNTSKLTRRNTQNQLESAGKITVDDNPIVVGMVTKGECQMINRVRRPRPTGHAARFSSMGAGRRGTPVRKKDTRSSGRRWIVPSGHSTACAFLRGERKQPHPP